ncbi:hypothetical protein [Levilactobacillus andaensis]|nr:hypothetical protein [Levilactobacillus andaensis]
MSSQILRNSSHVFTESEFCEELAKNDLHLNAFEAKRKEPGTPDYQHF